MRRGNCAEHRYLKPSLTPIWGLIGDRESLRNHGRFERSSTQLHDPVRIEASDDRIGTCASALSHNGTSCWMSRSTLPSFAAQVGGFAWRASAWSSRVTALEQPNRRRNFWRAIGWSFEDMRLTRSTNHLGYVSENVHVLPEYKATYLGFESQ